MTPEGGAVVVPESDGRGIHLQDPGALFIEDGSPARSHGVDIDRGVDAQAPGDGVEGVVQDFARKAEGQDERT